VPALAALALRIKQGNVPSSLWASLGIVVTFWILGAFAFSGLRTPGSERYVYMGAVGVLLVATDAARGIRFSKLGLAALFAACAISLATNAALLRDAGASIRDRSISARAQFTVLELARGHVDPGFAGITNLWIFREATPAGPYFEVVDNYGSLGLSLPELETQSEGVRAQADQVLASALELRLQPSFGGPAAGCRELGTRGEDGPIGFELPPGGASLRVRAKGPAPVALGRFGTSPSAELGSLSPGEMTLLRVSTDSSPKPWRASVAGASSVEVCAVR
jgi:hypothetical protein